MDNLFPTIILAVISSTAVGGVVQTLLSRKFQKQDKNDELAKTLEDIDARLRKNELADAQTHLLLLTKFTPSDHKAILTEAEHYFADLEGDSWTIYQLREWAKIEGVNIEYLEEVHKHNLTKEK